MQWRKKLAEVAGLPPLELMEGFYAPLDQKFCLPTLYHGINTYQEECGHGSGRFMDNLDKQLPIKWECLKPSDLYELLYHSDCDGEISPERCGPIADALNDLIPLLPDEDAGGHIGNWRQKTKLFVSGLRASAKQGKPLKFY
jgi:hypothetical protein